MPSTDPGQKAQEGTKVPPIIAYVLTILGDLIAYARQLENTPYLNAGHTNFQKFAAAWATHDIKHIVAQIRRGLMRALALKKYLETRAKAGRDIVPTPPPTRAEPEDVGGMAFDVRTPPKGQPQSTREPRTYPARQPTHDFDDPLYFSNPSAWELHTWLRSKPVGVLLAEICADLGMTPSNTRMETFNRIMELLGSLDHGTGERRYYEIKERRRRRLQDHLAYATGGWRWDVLEGDLLALAREMLGFVFGDELPEPSG